MQELIIVRRPPVNNRVPISLVPTCVNAKRGSRYKKMDPAAKVNKKQLSP